MLDLDELQFLAQMVDSMETAIKKLEKAYENNDSENFRNSKNSVLDFQKKIADILKEETRK